jgi:hypothetical protein
MTASFPSAIKTFTTKVDGTSTIEASHVNDLQDEVSAIETELGINSTNVPAKVVGTGNLSLLLAIRVFNRY